MLARRPKRKSWLMKACDIPGGQRGTASMTSERSSIAPRARALRAITALTIISISFGLGWPRASAASRNNKRQAAPAASRQAGPGSLPRSANRPEAKLMTVPLSFEPNQGQLASTVQFLSRGSGYALFLTPGKVVLNLERQQLASAVATGQAPEAASVDTLRMSLIGANPEGSRRNGYDRISQQSSRKLCELCRWMVPQRRSRQQRRGRLRLPERKA